MMLPIKSTCTANKGALVNSSSKLGVKSAPQKLDECLAVVEKTVVALPELSRSLMICLFMGSKVSGEKG